MRQSGARGSGGLGGHEDLFSRRRTQVNELMLPLGPGAARRLGSGRMGGSSAATTLESIGSDGVPEIVVTDGSAEQSQTDARGPKASRFIHCSRITFKNQPLVGIPAPSIVGKAISHADK